MPLTEALARSHADGKVRSHASGLEEDRFHQLPHVVSARAGDATVLMDRKRGAYFTLNEVGGRVWELVGAGATQSEIVERLLLEYDVDRELLEGDVAATLSRLAADRLIGSVIDSDPEPAERTPRPSARARMRSGELKVPSVFRSGLLIAWFKVLLRVRGFMGTLEWIRRRVERVPEATEVKPMLVKAAEWSVAMAGALYPGRALCLEQSLTLYFLLRKQGVAVKYCQGVQPYPFEAHAWVEYQGVVVNDVKEHVRLFASLPDQLP